jgi:WD40 repeat protein
LASGGEDRTVRIWDVTTGLELLTIKEHIEEVRSIAFSPDGKTLASGSLDGAVKLWSAASEQEVLAWISTRSKRPNNVSRFAEHHALFQRKTD